LHVVAAYGQVCAGILDHDNVPDPLDVMVKSPLIAMSAAFKLRAAVCGAEFHVKWWKL
jgi:hypothetical protein